MNRTQRSAQLFCICILLLPAAAGAVAAADVASSKDDAACRALVKLPDLDITSAELAPAAGATPQYCYVRGMISGRIRFHVQLPLPGAWNGRFLKIGDGGKDGLLNFADNRVAQGYAVANSNTGHDVAAEPGASFAFNNRVAEIDFGYRAVHLTANAARSVVKAYYGKPPQYSYFEGCSTGGRQALMEAQRFPYDFDGIVAGAPVNHYQASNSGSVWILQRMFRENFAGNLAFDSKGDGSFASLAKLNLLRDAVLAKCDARDGITDGVIDDPLSCDFKPEVDLAGKMCPGDANVDNCFTKKQIQTIKDVYSGAYDSRGRRILKGKAIGSEFSWPANIIPHAGNKLFPGRLGTGGDHINFLFYENDPGVPMSDMTDLSQIPDKTRNPPEYAWWEFNIDDYTAGKGDFMRAITDATDPNLTRFLVKSGKSGGRLLLYHGWGDGAANPEPTVDYYKDVLAETFRGDVDAARERIRLFMAPGMDHCQGGPGPSSWDRLAPLAEWVEKGKAPEYIVATHSTNNVVDNERKICPYPQKAVYTGPAGGQNNRANWVEGNFTCK